MFIRFDRQGRRENEGAIGADLDVRRALVFLLQRENCRGGRGALEIQPLARRDDVGAGEGNDELRRGRRAGSVTAAIPRPIAIITLRRSISGTATR